METHEMAYQTDINVMSDGDGSVVVDDLGQSFDNFKDEGMAHGGVQMKPL